jgi:formylglycine-generating enzyme required for sulfatase activity
MTVVPAGKFMMGSPENEPGRFSDEGPQREVTIAKPFAVGKFTGHSTNGMLASRMEGAMPISQAM